MEPGPVGSELRVIILERALDGLGVLGGGRRGDWTVGYLVSVISKH
jgi:hypothetical protein